VYFIVYYGHFFICVIFLYILYPIAYYGHILTMQSNVIATFLDFILFNHMTHETVAKDSLIKSGGKCPSIAKTGGGDIRGDVLHPNSAKR